MRTFLSILSAAVIGLIPVLPVFANPHLAVVARKRAQPSVPDPDLLWWKMSDGSGTTITAAVGPNGTTDCAWVTGASGGGYAIDSNGSSTEATANGTISPATNIVTVSLWIYPDAITGTHYVVMSDQATNYFSVHFASSTIRVSSFGTTGSRVETLAEPATGAWFHIFAVINNSTASGDIRIWLDGSEGSTLTATNTKTGTSNFADTTVRVLHNNNNFRLNGAVDDLRIWAGDQSAYVAAVYADPQ